MRIKELMAEDEFCLWAYYFSSPWPYKIYDTRKENLNFDLGGLRVSHFHSINFKVEYQILKRHNNIKAFWI